MEQESKEDAQPPSYRNSTEQDMFPPAAFPSPSVPDPRLRLGNSNFDPTLNPNNPMLLNRHRRYSMHSTSDLGSAGITGTRSSRVLLGNMPDNDQVSLCDLALITKGKLTVVKEKPKEEQIERVNKVLPGNFMRDETEAFGSVTSSKDLRREVLLSSLQRSLSVGNDGLSAVVGSSSNSMEVSSSSMDTSFSCAPRNHSTQLKMAGNDKMSKSQEFGFGSNQNSKFACFNE